MPQCRLFLKGRCICVWNQDWSPASAASRGHLLNIQEVTDFTVFIFFATISGDTMFLASISQASVSIEDEEPIIWNFVSFNPGGHFNTDLGAYIAPFDGYYQ